MSSNWPSSSADDDYFDDDDDLKEEAEFSRYVATRDLRERLNLNCILFASVLINV
jgi:hypothetical protein